MFVIFGSPRSGTTLLKETLNLHTEVFIPHETSFIVPTAYVIDRIASPAAGKEIIKNIIVSSSDYPTALKPYLGETDIESAVRDAPYTLPGILNSIYAKLGLKVGKKKCGDKSPNDLISIQIFHNLGLFDSDIKFIHIVRDIRGVMASLLNVNWAPSGTEVTFPRLWNYTNLHLHHAMKGKKNYMILRYEDMVAAPNGTIKDVANFLEIGFEARMLDEKNRGVYLRHLPHHANLSRPYSSSRANAWLQELPNSVRSICETSASEGLKTFGYVGAGEELT